MSSPLWSTVLQEMVTTPSQLAAHLEMPLHELKGILQAHEAFPIRIPKRWLALIPPKSVDHPLLRQVLPLQQELDVSPHYSKDPLGEEAANTTPGLLHKYKGRVLLITAPSCAIHCRYCFRRHFDYTHNQRRQEDWQIIFDSIAQDESIHEVILSGGDPLMLKNDQIVKICHSLSRIAHVKTLRLHTRMPIVLPERMDHTLLHTLKKLNKRVVMVVHCNHSLEIDTEVKKTLGIIKQHDIDLLNQSVLLKGVNDDADTLVALSHRLWECGVLPYYLHLPDAVQGTQHFDVKLDQAQKLHSQMQSALPGYLVPKLAQEIAGEASKRTYAASNDPL